MKIRTPILSAIPLIAALYAAQAMSLAGQETGRLAGDRLGADNRITIGEAVTFHSDIYGRGRQVLLFLPDDYSSSGERYPVVYLLDGSFFFLPTAGLVDFYSTINKMPKMIVAAVVHEDRMDELSTAPDDGGAEFAAFLRDELLPFVDERYRTEPLRVLIGHSLGGVFAVHSLLADPDLFDAHIAASPALYWNGGSEIARAREVVDSGRPLESFLHLTYSGGDGDNIRSSTDALVEILEASPPPGLKWHFDFLPEDRHNSSPIRSVLGGLTRLFSGWAYLGENDAEAMREHYRSLSAELGFECRPEKGSVASRGRTLLRRGEVEGAIDIFQYIAAIHPHDPDVHAALGAAYRTADRTGEAIEAYERVLELRPGDPSVLSILRDLRGGRSDTPSPPGPRMEEWERGVSRSGRLDGRHYIALRAVVSRTADDGRWRSVSAPSIVTAGEGLSPQSIALSTLDHR